MSETVALAQVIVDIWGPACVRSIGGAKYALVFADDATSQRTPYYISDQRAETTIEALNQFTVMAERQTGKKLKKICCDNEFHNTLWENWEIERGVIIEFTAPYLSAANGMAEWTMGIVFGTVWILLLEAKMSDGWWAEACDYAIKAGNLLPSSWHPGKVPEEEWSGKRQTVGHLQVWGSTCYTKIPAAKVTANYLRKDRKVSSLAWQGMAHTGSCWMTYLATRSLSPVMSYSRNSALRIPFLLVRGDCV